jgi:formate/nitrite transporter FocA (FNT family)
MNQEAHTPGDPALVHHHHKPRRVAQQLEKYMGVAMAAAAVVLLGILAYGLMNTGSGTPSWMH